MIVSVSANKALDSNVGGAHQHNAQHPRIFLWDPVPSAHNHHWKVEALPNGNYILKSSGKALDGNLSVPNHVSNYPSPFLWDPVPSAPNHQWRIVPTGYGTFGIVNVANNKALDANVGATQHPDAQHPSPFLWDFVPSAPNHQWRFQPLKEHTYTITCVSSGKALDANTGACPQVSPQHPRPFVWDPVPSAANHQWKLVPVGSGFMLVSHSAHKALDGNVGVPQHNPQYPTPFLWQPTPSAPNHVWNLIPIAGSDAVNIVCSANNLALDGNTGAAPHTSPQHQSPFLWQFVPSAPNHQWRIHLVQ